MAGRGSSLPSVMSHDFSEVQAQKPQRSVFGRPFTHKTCFDAGWLVPIYLNDILPGDTLSLQGNFLARLSTLIFPIMDNVFLDLFFFFVPNRLVWDNWERFQGAQDDPGDTTDYEIPRAELAPPNGATGIQLGTLGDYFGLPVNVDIPEIDWPSALPFRMYDLVYNTWFRDENIQDSLVVNRDDGPDAGPSNPFLNNWPLRRRGKRHDYFTSCLPEPQKGDGVMLPLGTSAPVIGDGQSLGLLTAGNRYLIQSDASGFNGQLYIGDTAGAAGSAQVGSTYAGDVMVGLNTNPALSHVYADLSNATAATVNQLREAIAVQQILELDARGGTRYVEALRMRFGVDAGDYRLQRPEYLGGSSQHISVSAIAQTTPNASPTNINALGNLAAYSQATSRVNIHKSFVEHGYVIGLANVRADLTYHQGIARHWTKRTRFELFEPALAHLGEQAVLNREIYYVDGGTNSNVVFGYQERWAEYRYMPSIVTNLMRPGVSGTLSAWNLTTTFASQPALDSTFIVDNPPIDRVIAVPTQPHVIFDSFFNTKHARLMPVYSVPGLQRF